MNRLLLTLVVLLFAAVGAEAKYWKIGPGSVTGMDFASISAAMESSNVSTGDTLYLDQYYNPTGTIKISKGVVIIGTGYDTSLTDEQVVATLNGTIELNVDDIVIRSVKLNDVHFYADNCIIDRCYTHGIYVKSSLAGLNHVYSSYVTCQISGYDSSDKSRLDIQNCVISYNSSLDYNQIQNLKQSIIKNNTIVNTYEYKSYYCLFNVSSSTICNNFILKTSSSYVSNDLSDGVVGDGSGNAIEHNILSRSSAISNYPTNKIGWTKSNLSKLFDMTGSYSDYYKLSTKTGDNVAVNYATDGGEVGCHGGMFGCPSGGRPQYIPYFSKVTVGSRSENGKLPVSVTIKIQEE